MNLWIQIIYYNLTKTQINMETKKENWKELTERKVKEYKNNLSEHNLSLIRKMINDIDRNLDILVYKQNWILLNNKND